MISIIPAIDILNGRCVRLRQGDFEKSTAYGEAPVVQAQIFESWGLKRLHLVDLDGVRQKHISNWPVLKQIASRTKLTIDFGGGIQSDEDIARAFDCGASQITAGSISVKNRDMVGKWISVYGPGRIILGVDVKDNAIAFHGWQETCCMDLRSFIEIYRTMGIKDLICTDVRRDGMLAGPAVSLYRELNQRYPDMRLIAGGGVASVQDIRLLDREGVNAVIIGKAFYERAIKKKDLEPFGC